MTKLLEGYYKASDHFYKILKVCVSFCFLSVREESLCIQIDGDNCAASSGGGREYPCRIEYGDFGKANFVNQ